MPNEEKNSEKLLCIEPLIERVSDYTKTNYELAKLKTISKSADIIARIVSRGLVIAASVMFILILSMGISFLLGDFFKNIAYGFFCVAAFYCLVALALYFIFHQRIKTFFHNQVLEQFFK